MNILLDTHVLVWAQVDSPRLGKKARAALLKDSNTLWISSVTALEIGRLLQGGKLEFGLPAREWFDKALRSLEARSQPMDDSIAFESYQLPGGFHSDPADRMLVATARLHGLRLMTADERILSYQGVSSMNACR